MVYLSGVTDHHIADDQMVDHIVDLVEQKAAAIEAEIEAEKARSNAAE
jgi:(E)-4-hydroxy-3-methylbut-2-enyl-diphosphate synthase